MSFNFSISNAPVVNRVKTLKPWGIYDVTFEGFEQREFQSKAGNTCKVFDLKFKGDEGSAVITKFWPTDKDAERRSFDAANGGTRTIASNFEQLMEILKQAVYAFSDKDFEKLQEVSKKFKSFDDVAKAVGTILNKHKGESIQIKLGGYVNKSGYPTIDIPSLLFVNDNQEAVTSSIWISKKDLEFGDYEATQKAKFDAKPSNPEKKTTTTADIPEVTVVEEPSSDDEVNWDELATL